MLAKGATELCQRDSGLANIVARCGLPPLWLRPPEFATLVQIILEQRVSLASAKATFAKLERALGSVTPERLARGSEAELTDLGFSRQKAGFCQAIAKRIVSKGFDLEALEATSDERAQAQLIALPGIGPWTANIYLLMALARPDAWPSGDLALAIAYRKVRALAHRPTAMELDGYVEAWKPWRAVGARILWLDYLVDRKRYPA